MKKFKLLDLFSGIGGFSLGLERTGGFETVAFCEIEDYPRRVLNKHWPKVPIYDDVRTLSAERLAEDGIEVDAICGGFPCQDISLAGTGDGIDGKRSGLWQEYGRLIDEIRPRYAIMENVSALLGRGLGRVLGDLAALGYDAEWHCIQASSIGAPHIRDRVWIIAYPMCVSFTQRILTRNDVEMASRANSFKWRKIGTSLKWHPFSLRFLRKGWLNPAVTEWMMGFKIGHTDLRDVGMQSCRKSQN